MDWGKGWGVAHRVGVRDGGKWWGEGIEGGAWIGVRVMEGGVWIGVRVMEGGVWIGVRVMEGGAWIGVRVRLPLQLPSQRSPQPD